MYCDVGIFFQLFFPFSNSILLQLYINYMGESTFNKPHEGMIYQSLNFYVI